MLINSNSIEEIVEIVDNSGFNIGTLASGVGDYIVVYGNKDEQIKEILKSKLKMYREHVA